MAAPTSLTKPHNSRAARRNRAPRAFKPPFLAFNAGNQGRYPQTPQKGQKQPFLDLTKNSMAKCNYPPLWVWGWPPLKGEHTHTLQVGGYHPLARPFSQ